MLTKTFSVSSNYSHGEESKGLGKYAYDMGKVMVDLGMRDLTFGAQS